MRYQTNHRPATADTHPEQRQQTAAAAAVREGWLDEIRGRIGEERDRKWDRKWDRTL